MILARERGYSGFSGKAVPAENLPTGKNMFKCRLARQSGDLKNNLAIVISLRKQFMRSSIALCLLLGSALGSVSNPGLAQTTVVQAAPAKSAYLQDGGGPIVRSQDGLCWRSGYWEQDDAVTGCDGALVSPVMKASAPALVADPMIANKEVPPATVSAQCDISVTLASDQNFRFGKATLTNTAKQRIDEVITKLASCGSANLILITGHTDRLGAAKYNQKLSAQRATNVASYLKSKGVTNKMQIVGAGASDPILQCGNNLSRQKLVSCLSPNRRVVIKVQPN
ncbi:OmpA family protein [Collimonas sp. OK607]|uniref:OmpA family protein n=1 Tax=Collimonas sp. OK607 TaxID=1798194 RepID=UPI000B8724A2|nr:OmpA family protein [Collimonas sp. OK607]